MKRNTKPFGQKFINTHLVWVLICIIGLLIGSLYCVSMKNDVAFFLNLSQMIRGDKLLSGTTGKIFRTALIIHLIQLFGIWGSGFIKTTRPIGIVILFLICLNYGFSISALLLLYGLKGIGLGALLFGIQGMGLLFLGIMLNEHSRQYGQRGKEIYGKIYRQVSLYCGVGAILISIVDTYFQPFIWQFFKI